MIDSEQVPWGKGEKHPGEGDEIVSETVYLQAVGAPFMGWQRAYWRMSQRVYLCCLFNPDLGRRRSESKLEISVFN